LGGVGHLPTSQELNVTNLYDFRHTYKGHKMTKITETQLIDSLKGLKEIKPNKQWAVLLKSQILDCNTEKQVEFNSTDFVMVNKAGIAEIISRIFSQKKLAYASATLAFLVIGIFGFARYTMPGDMFYPVKRIAEQTQQTPLQIAYNRSEDLIKVVKENKTQNLSPAIIEYKASISDAVKNLSDSLAIAKEGDKSAVEEIINEVKKIQKNQKQLETLGVNIEDPEQISELDAALSFIVENQIADLEESTLTDSQQEILEKAKELYIQGEYSEALEEILQMAE